MAKKQQVVDPGQRSLSSLEKGAQRLRVFQESGLGGPPLKQKDAERVAAELGITVRHVRDLYRTYLVNPTAEALAPRPRGRRRGSHQLRDDVIVVVKKEARRLLGVQAAPSLKAACEEIRSSILEDIAKHPFSVDDIPTCKQIRAIIDNMPPTTLIGSKSVRHRSALEPHYSGIVAERPLDAVQMDHTAINVMLVDPEDGSVTCRAVVTFIVDVCTRVILGFYLGHEGESVDRCGKVLANAILPKSALLRSLGLSEAFYFPMHGVFDRLYADWAPAHRSDAFRAALLYAGVSNPAARAPGGPHMGGHVERLIGTMMGKCHFLPGRTGRNPQDRGDYDSQTDACMTMREVERWLWHQIAIYHEQPHEGLGNVPPALKWRLETKRNPIAEFQGDPHHFAKLCLPRVKRMIRSNGIRLECQRYAAPILNECIGMSAYVHYDPRSAGEVYILVANQFHTLKCQNKLPFAGISFSELKWRRYRSKQEVKQYRDREGAEREQYHRVSARAEVATAERKQRARKREQGATMVALLNAPKSDKSKMDHRHSFVATRALGERWSIVSDSAFHEAGDD